jgi:hypothetical protein
MYRRIEAREAQKIAAEAAKIQAAQRERERQRELLKNYVPIELRPA